MFPLGGAGPLWVLGVGAKSDADSILPPVGRWVSMAAIRRNDDVVDAPRPGVRLFDRYLAGDTALDDLLTEMGCVLYVHDVDAALTIVDAIGATEMVVGYASEELRGRSMVSLIADDDALEDPTRRTATDDFEGDVRVRRGDGTFEWVMASTRLRSTPDGDRVFGLAQTLRVLKVRHAAQIREVETDALTGLLGRDAFMRRLTRAMVSNPERVVLAIIDLNSFVQVVDAHGLQVGDELLHQIGSRLATHATDELHLARLGADEFGVCLTSWRSDGEVLALIEELLADVHQPVTVGPHVFEMRASVGLTRATDGVTTTELLRQADVAMTEARHSESGCLMHTATTAKVSQEELGIIHRLSQRLEDELVMWFQPIVNLDTGETIALEALARWNHPERGVLPPGAFLDAVAIGGLSSRLDKWALAATARVSAARTNSGEPIRLSVNVTAEGLRSPELMPSIRQLRTMGALAPDQLTIELSERDIDEDLKQLAPVLNELRRLGVGLSLDDYGTGFSSLIRLRDLPFTEVKMDRSFVSRITRDHTDWSIVRSTVEMSKLLDLEIVAEGIEDIETAEALADMACGRGQGYLFAKPAPFDQLVEEGYVQLPMWADEAVS